MQKLFLISLSFFLLYFSSCTNSRVHKDAITESTDTHQNDSQITKKKKIKDAILDSNEKNLDIWINLLLSESENGFANLKDKPIENTDDLYTLKDSVTNVMNMPFSGTYEKDFAERDVLVFRSKQEVMKKIKPCVEDILDNFGNAFGKPSKRHESIYLFKDSSRNCSITVILEEFPFEQKGMITIEIRKDS